MDGNYGNGFNQDPYQNNQNNNYGDGYGANYGDNYGNTGYDVNNGYEMNNRKQFGDSAPADYTQALQSAKLSLSYGLFALLGSLAALFMLFVLNRIFYVMGVFPIISVLGVIAAIKAIKIDKGIPKAYIGMVLSILSFFPGVLCTLLFILDMVACFVK